ncbi:MAG: hypothetical protein ACLR2O_07035 [Coprococcus sp.]
MEVYLDNSATTRAYECVRDIVGKVMCEDYGNPSSMHKKGVDAEAYVREAEGDTCKDSGRCRKRNFISHPVEQKVTTLH